MSDPRTRYWLPEDRIEGETNDCLVRAACAVTSMPYRDVHAILAKHGRQPRKGANSDVSIPAYAELGLRCVQMNVRYTHSWVPGHEFYDRRSGFHKWRDSHHNCVRRTEMTLGQFLRKRKVGKFIVFVRGHALAVIDGVIVDASQRASVRRYVEAYFTFA